MRASVYSALGLLTPQMILSGLMMGALTVPGNWVASKIVSRMGDNIHAKLIEALIAIGGIWFLGKALLSA